MMKSLLNVFTPVVVACLLFSACKKSGTNPPAGLAISTISVGTGQYNTAVVITGIGFSPTTADDHVAFNGKAAVVTSATNTKLTAIVPKGAGTGSITITINNVTVTGPGFTYVPTVTVSTFAGSGNGKSVDGTGTNASFSNPYALATDKAGNLYVADIADNLIRKITPAGLVTTLAGSGVAGSSNGTGTAASFNTPLALAADASGNIYVADHGNLIIRKITPAGVVTTLAGSGITGVADGTGTASSFGLVKGITIDAFGNLYVADGYIRKITPAGVVTTIFATSATFFGGAIAIDAAGTIFLAGGADNIVSKISATGAMYIWAGSGKSGADNLIGNAATFSYVSAVAVDNSGNLIATDTNNELVRMVTPDAVVSTVAGILKSGLPTVDGPVAVASFYTPTGVAVDPSGIIYISESNTHKIRKIVME